LVRATSNIINTGSIGIHILVRTTTGGGIIVTDPIGTEILGGTTGYIINTGSIGIHILVRTTTGGGIIITFIIRTKILC
jgi:hypothetical protein